MDRRIKGFGQQAAAGELCGFGKKHGVGEGLRDGENINAFCEGIRMRKAEAA